MGAASADAIYGIIVAFSLTLISNFLLDNRLLIQIFGGIFITVVGVRIFITKPRDEIRDDEPNTPYRDFISTFVVTISNPLTIMGLFAAFAVFDLIDPERCSVDAWILVGGIIAGACFWWLSLVAVFTLLKSKFKLSQLQAVNRAVGIIIVLFGIGVLISAFK
jgi:threonine/homoserine/homoserine lactone efflux protein